MLQGVQVRFGCGHTSARCPPRLQMRQTVKAHCLWCRLGFHEAPVQLSCVRGGAPDRPKGLLEVLQRRYARTPASFGWMGWQAGPDHPFPRCRRWTGRRAFVHEGGLAAAPYASTGGVYICGPRGGEPCLVRSRGGGGCPTASRARCGSVARGVGYSRE